MMLTHSLGLLTDLYQLTMAYGYWKQQKHNVDSVFHLFFRHLPFQGGFTIAAGLESVIHYIENFRFEETDLHYLAGLKSAQDTPLFPQEFLKELSHMCMTVDMDAVPEGSVVFPFEPLIRVRGPLIQAQLLETILLNQINFASLIATKAARVCLAAAGDPVMEFGLRRAQGMDGAMTASRSAYIGGCDATSNVLAGKMFGIPVVGTHAHSWVMVFDSERSAFEAYADAFPDNSIFLVDTYDTLQGVREAIEVAKQMQRQGHRFIGIRLDSGDLAYLSIQARQLLDAAGFEDALIVASNNLDEWIIADLKRQGAQIHMWGVGTSLVTGKEHSSLDGVYKLSALRYGPNRPWVDRLKLSEQMIKISNPGILQVRRFFSRQEAMADMIYDTQLGIEAPSAIIDPMDATRRKEILKNWTSQDLLVPILRQGKCVYNIPCLENVRAYSKEQLGLFHRSIQRFTHPHLYPVGMEPQLYERKVALVTKLRQDVRARARRGGEA